MGALDRVKPPLKRNKEELSVDWYYNRRDFSKTMFKLGESVAACEHELIHGLTNLKQRLDYMNWRFIGATLHAIRVGLPVTELVQFKGVHLKLIASEYTRTSFVNISSIFNIRGSSIIDLD